VFKTIAFSLILAWIALCCSILAVFYEYTAENNRYEAESRNSYQLRDNQLIYFRDREVIRSNVQHSEIHSEFFFKKNGDSLNWKKDSVFKSLVGFIKQDIAYLQNTEDHKNNKKLTKWIEDSKNFIVEYEKVGFISSVTQNEFSIRWAKLKNLSEEYLVIARELGDSRKKGIIKNRLNAERATNISSNLILIAFICEIFIFGLLQLLEIKTERRLMR